VNGQLERTQNGDGAVDPGTAGDGVVAVLWRLLEKVKDPEIPVLSLRDLGVLRDVEKKGERVTVTITPTYSGCPAMDVMRSDIRSVLAEAGYGDCEVKTVLSPAWTTDWMTDEGRRKLKEFGIAPPAHSSAADQSVRCPRCAADSTVLISEYGSTACKAMYRCEQCSETFCYFKVI